MSAGTCSAWLPLVGCRLDSQAEGELTNAEVADLYRRYGYFMQRRCRLLLRDPAAADDALQEAFMKVMAHGSALRTVDRPLRWLLRVVDRCCFDQMRRNRRHLVSASVTDGDGGEPIHPGVDHVLQSAVLSLLARLDDDDQQIAVMAFVEGMSQGEIADEIGRSRVTVNKKVQSIRERAQRVLGEGHD